MDRPAFDLLEQPWIPCERLDGSRAELGLRDTLLQAHTLAAIRDASPLVTLALHRLLLAVIHRVVDGPRDTEHWKQLWEAGRLDPEAFEAYFVKWRHRFDLFDPEWPFFQVGGLDTIDGKQNVVEPTRISKTALELSDGHNAPLFGGARRFDFLPAGAAARGLLSLQNFALGGGVGALTNRFPARTPNYTHAPMVGQVSTILLAQSVFHTLLLNAVDYGDDSPFARAGEDAPVWEQTRLRTPGAVVPYGYLDWLTLPARYVRLVAGWRDGRLGASHLVYCTGVWIERGGPVRNPMAMYVPDDDSGVRPLPLIRGRAVWRDASVLFALGDPGDRGQRPLAVSMAARRLGRNSGWRASLHASCLGLVNDKAKPFGWQEDILPAPLRLLQERELVACVHAAVEGAEETGRALRDAFTKLAWACLETDQKKPDPSDVGRLRTRMVTASGFWAELDAPFRAFLGALEADPETALRSWKVTLYRAATSSFDRGAESAPGTLTRRLRAEVVGRRALAFGLTSLKPTSEPAEPASPQPELS